jgi:hypothetical protein
VRAHATLPLAGLETTHLSPLTPSGEPRPPSRSEIVGEVGTLVQRRSDHSLDEPLVVLVEMIAEPSEEDRHIGLDRGHQRKEVIDLCRIAFSVDTVETEFGGE